MNSLDCIARDPGFSYDFEKAYHSFHQQGFLVLKDFIPKDLVRSIRSHVMACYQDQDAAGLLRSQGGIYSFLPDILSFDFLESCNYIFFYPVLARLIKHLLGSDEIVYWGDSTIQVGASHGGFHKDNVARESWNHSDWWSPYSLIRCGFYLQDHHLYSGGLDVRIGSHKYPGTKHGRQYAVPTQAGDLIVWNMRLTHSGHAHRMRLIHKGVNRRFKRLLPQCILAPAHDLRIAAFCAFGATGVNLETYLSEQMMSSSHVDSYRESFAKSICAEQRVSICEQSGFSFKQVFERDSSWQA